jgi:hypothetical protein
MRHDDLHAKVFQRNERLFRVFSTPTRPQNAAVSFPSLHGPDSPTSSNVRTLDGPTVLSQKFIVAHTLVAIFYTELAVEDRPISIRPPLRELAASIDPICFRPWVSRINSTHYPVEGKWTGHYTYATDIRAQRISDPMSIEFRVMPSRVEDQVQLEVLGVGDDEAGEFYVHGTVDTSTGEVFLEKVYKRGI